MIRILLAAALLAGVSLPASATVYYVVKTFAGIPPGSPWANNATTNLQAAINQCFAGDEVWVQAGTYAPVYASNSTAGVPTSATRTFYVNAADIKLYGGFAGNETASSQRNPAVNVTILNGTYNGVGQGPSSIDAYTVLTTTGRTAACVIDGFLVTGGYNTNGFLGAGMSNNISSPTVNNCTFRGNKCPGGNGGGMYNRSGSNPTVTNCTFSANTTSGRGGGMFNEFNANPTITACIFSGNTAGTGGPNDRGGGLLIGAGTTTITNCTFYGNTIPGATARGAGIGCEGSGGGSLTNCIFYNNTTPGNSGSNQEEIYKISGSGTLTVTNCIVRDYSSTATNNYTAVAVTTNGGANPGLADSSSPAGPDGIWRTADDGLRITCSSVAKDAGSGTATATSFDAIGNRRQGTLDIGAYEAQGANATFNTMPSFTTAVVNTQTANTNAGYTDCASELLLIASNGTAPLSGSVIAKTYVLGTVLTTAGGKPYVPRTYEVTPVSNAAAATATVVLHFTQADFTAYNAVRGSYPSLPVNVFDAAGYKANLRITQEHGISGTGLPGSYSGSSVLITPSSISYDFTAQRWDVVFPVTGFSGFFAHTVQTVTPLPVALTAFTARAAGSANALSWNAAGRQGSVFTIERSTTGSSFTDIGTVWGGTGSDYAFTDATPEAVSYYRLRTIAENGVEAYSPVALVRRGASGDGTVTLSPVPVASSFTLHSTDAALEGSTATVQDVQGREMTRFVVGSSVYVDASGWPAGLYLLRLATGETLRFAKH